jgi:hypothetical protein
VRTDSFEADWDTFAIDSEKHPDDEDLLQEVRFEYIRFLRQFISMANMVLLIFPLGRRADLEYESKIVADNSNGTSKLEAIKASLGTGPSSSPENSDSEESSASSDEDEFALDFRAEMVDAFSFARYEDEEPPEELTL